MKKYLLHLLLATSLGLPVVARAQIFTNASGNIGVKTGPHSLLGLQVGGNPAGINITGPEPVLSLEGPSGSKWVWAGSRSDVGGANEDLKLLRYVNGSFSGIALQVENTTGNIGIGTTTPQAKLVLKVDEGPLLRFVRGSVLSHEENWLDVVSSDNSNFQGADFTFRTHMWNGSGYEIRNSLHFSPNGNVGIGTSTPHAKLDVDGDVQMAGPITMGADGDQGGKYIKSNGRLHIQSTERLYLNPFSPLSDVVVGGGDGPANLIVTGKINCQTIELTSDRNKKQDFQRVSATEILAKVAALPATTWAYTNSPSVRHLGPMAQDFKVAFNLGEDDKHIGAGDGIGVALAAIKGLHEIVQAKDSEIVALKRKNADLEQQMVTLSKQIGSIQETIAILAKAMPKSAVQQASFRPEAKR